MLPSYNSAKAAESAAARVDAALYRKDYMQSALCDRAAAAIQAKIPGWSNLQHYLFFRAVLEAMPGARRMLVLGVFQGRDLAFIGDCLRRYYPGRALEIVGVDRFTDSPCPDWPLHAAGQQSWSTAGFDASPSRQVAQANLSDLGYAGGVRLVEANDVEFLASTDERFDIVYFDTSHDLASVSAQLRAARRVCNPGALLCGDDYADTATWGVRSAVCSSFSGHGVYAGKIWFADLADMDHPAG